MIDINELEETILIEANDFDMNITQILAEIKMREPASPQEEIYNTASNIIGSLVLQDYVILIQTTYKKEGDDCYSRVSGRDLSKEEIDTFLKHPEQWDEMGVFSKTGPVEVRITEEGRAYLHSL